MSILMIFLWESFHFTDTPLVFFGIVTMIIFYLSTVPKTRILSNILFKVTEISEFYWACVYKVSFSEKIR